jgi:hypothetical protein
MNRLAAGHHGEQFKKEVIALTKTDEFQAV